MSDDLVARFEPARAALRPRACDERNGCWVKVGAPGITTDNTGKCKACQGPILIAGNENAHAAALTRCSRAQGGSS